MQIIFKLEIPIDKNTYDLLLPLDRKVLESVSSGGKCIS